MTQRTGSKKSANCRLEIQSSGNAKKSNIVTTFCANTHTVLTIRLYNT